MTDISDFISQLNIITNVNIESKNEESRNIIVNTNESKNEEKRVKILIVSTHVNQSNGYSKVIYNIIKELVKYPWINIVHFGTQKITNGNIGRTYPQSVKVIDGTSMEKNKELGFAFQELPDVIHSEKPDMVFIYNDISVVCSYIEEMDIS